MNKELQLWFCFN